MRKLAALLSLFATAALAQQPNGTINSPIYATGYISQVGGINVTTKIPPQPNHPTNLNIFATEAITGTWSIQLPNPAFEGQIIGINCGASVTNISVNSSDGSSLDSSLPNSCAAYTGFGIQFDQRSNIWRNLGSSYSSLFKPFAGVTSQWPWQLNADGTWTLKQPSWSDISGSLAAVGSSLVPTFANAVTVASVSTSSSSNTVTISGAASLGIKIGQQLFCNNLTGNACGSPAFPSGTIVTNVSGNTVTLSNNANATTTATLQFGYDRWSSTSTALANSIGASSLYLGGASIGNYSWINFFNAKADYNLNPFVSLPPSGGIGTAAVFGARVSDATASGGYIRTIENFCVHDVYTANGSGCEYVESNLKDGFTVSGHIQSERSVYSRWPLVLTDPYNINAAGRVTAMRLDSGKGSIPAYQPWGTPQTISAYIDTAYNGASAASGITVGDGSIAADSDGLSPIIKAPINSSFQWFASAGVKTWDFYSAATSSSGRVALGNKSFSLQSADGTVSYFSNSTQTIGTTTIGPSTGDYVGIIGAAAGSGVVSVKAASGVDTNVALALSGQGTGVVSVESQAQFLPGTTSRAPATFNTGVAPTSPSEGDVWKTSTNFVGQINGSTANFVTTNDMSVGQWTDYTFTVSGSTSGTMTCSTCAMRYTKVGKTIMLTFLLNATTGTATGSYVYLSLPVALKSSLYPVCTSTQVSGGAAAQTIGNANGATTSQLWHGNSAATISGQWIAGSCTYEAD